MRRASSEKACVRSATSLGTSLGTQLVANFDDTADTFQGNFFDNQALICKGSSFISDSIDVCYNIRSSDIYTGSVSPYSTLIAPLRTTYIQTQPDVMLFDWIEELLLKQGNGVVKIKYTEG